MVGTTAEPGDAGAAIGEEQRRRIGHARQTVVAHLEQSEFVGRPESVLGRPQQAQRVVPVAFELQDRVDHVLEHPWPGEAAVLGDVADEHDGHVAVLRFDDQALCAPSDLADTAREGGRGGVVDRLDRVDDHEFGFRGSRSRR